MPFAYGWWQDETGYCYYWNGWQNNPWYWWSPCSAPYLTTWIDFGWNYPCYWDYGYGQNAYVTYYNNDVYVGGQRYATELDYYSQVRNLARSAPTLTQQQLAGSSGCRSAFSRCRGPIRPRPTSWCSWR